MKLLPALFLSTCLAGGISRSASAQAVVLCFGDSITMGRDVSIPYPTRLATNTGHTTINGGVGGELASGGLRRIDLWLTMCNPTHVLIMFGTNDINQPGQNLGRSAEVVIEIALRCRAYGAIPIVGTIPPTIGPRSWQSSLVFTFNSHLRSLAAAHAILLADINAAFGSGSGLMNSDGFHPNDMGQEIIAQTFAEQITEVLAANPSSALIPDTGAIAQTFAVDATAEWIATPDQPWITITDGLHGIGDGTVTYNIAPNTGAARTGSITLAENPLTRTFSITQEMAVLKISPAAHCIPGIGATGQQLRIVSHLPWTATASRRSWVTITSGASGVGNGTLTFDVAPNAGAARASSIRVTIGDTTRTLRINQWPVPSHPLVSADGDFDGDGAADMALYAASNAQWAVWMSSGAKFLFTHFGTSPKVPVPADYDGDGQVDFAVYQPPTGNWYILQSSDGQVVRRNLGRSRTVPVPGDYDGDGFADLAVYHPVLGRWYFRCSTAGSYSAPWGLAGDVPVPADYDGDGKTDLAVYTPSNGLWQIFRSSNGRAWNRRLGSARNLPVPADYDGDGLADLAVYHHLLGDWRIRESASRLLVKRHLGWKTTLPVPADYDGDGATDPAVYHPASRSWYLRQSTSTHIILARHGGPGQLPVLSWPMIHSWLGLR